MINEAKSHLKAILRSKLTFINLKTGRKEQHAPEFIEWAKSLVLDEVNSNASIQDRIKQVLTELKQNTNNITN